MDWPIIIAAVAATVVVPPLFAGFLLFGEFSVQTARLGYLYCGTTMTAIAGVIGITERDPVVIGWVVLGVACAAFGHWGVPFLQKLFTGEYDDQLVKLFRE